MGTDKWVNSGLTAAIVLFVVRVPPAPGPPKAPKTLGALLWSLDPIGTVSSVTSIVCLLLALQVGSETPQNLSS
jgi:hypothetical protein